MIRIHTHPYGFKPFAVEGTLPSGAKGVAPDVGQQEPDADWQPI